METVLGDILLVITEKYDFNLETNQYDQTFLSFLNVGILVEVSQKLVSQSNHPHLCHSFD